jgi:hypothetical protein
VLQMYCTAAHLQHALHLRCKCAAQQRVLQLRCTDLGSTAYLCCICAANTLATG